MFENCVNMTELNMSRLEAIKCGTPTVIVNREYGKRRAFLLSSQERTFKRVPFYPVPLPKLDLMTGIENAYWDESDPYRLIIEE